MADRYGASIFSVDSMQVFRGMDIGTAKPSKAVRARVVHHMIDVAQPSVDFSVMEFQDMGRRALHDARATGSRTVIVGGSGLHFRSIVDPMTFAPTDVEIRDELEAMSLDKLQKLLVGIDVAAAEVLDLHNPRRVIRAIEVWRLSGETPSERAASEESKAVRSYRSFIEHASFGLDAGSLSSERIEARLHTMLRKGLLDEVRGLAPDLGRTAAQAVGYKELLDVVTGQGEISDASAEIIRATRALVKRQRTFFRRDPRIEWIPWQDDEDVRIESAVNHIGEVAGWNS